MTLSLRKIEIDKSTCQHSDIVENRHYIAIIYGLSYLGKFNKMWYGWNFKGWVNPAGIQLNGIEELYEVTDPDNILKG